MVGFGVLASNSALAVCNSWGDAGSVAFVLVADAALVLLFVYLREFGRRRGRIKAAVWALTTLLTAMLAYASGVAPPVVVAVGALVLLCLGEFERAQIGLGGQYSDLVKMGLSVVACDSALAHHHAHGDAGSLAFVFFAYVGFLTIVWFFLRRFNGRARGAGQ